jgi:hypothetical protein
MPVPAARPWPQMGPLYLTASSTPMAARGRKWLGVLWGTGWWSPPFCRVRKHAAHNSPLTKSAVVLSAAGYWAARFLAGPICCAAREPSAFCQRADKLP